MVYRAGGRGEECHLKAEMLLQLGIACASDFELLRKCLEATKAERVVMIGSGLGVLSAVVMEYSKAFLLSIDIHSVDKETENLKAIGLWDPSRIVQVLAESANFGFAWMSSSTSLFDVAVVDGGHEYYQVKPDIKAWVPHLRPGGIIFFHDYKATDAPLHHPGVGQAVEESEVANWPVFGREGWSIAFQKPEGA